MRFLPLLFLAGFFPLTAIASAPPMPQKSVGKWVKVSIPRGNVQVELPGKELRDEPESELPLKHGTWVIWDYVHSISKESDKGSASYGVSIIEGDAKAVESMKKDQVGPMKELEGILEKIFSEQGKIGNESGVKRAGQTGLKFQVSSDGKGVNKERGESNYEIFFFPKKARGVALFCTFWNVPPKKTLDCPRFFKSVKFLDN